jgi:inorganic pyrophosphatase
MILPEPFAKNKTLINVVIETPRGSQNKYVFNAEQDYFELKKILPFGTVFPIDFGFIPGTLGEDNQPVDVLVFSDFPFFPGCVIQCRCLGVLNVEQKDKSRKYRNDRIVAVPDESQTYSGFKTAGDINQSLLNELIRFFEYYNEMEGKKFKFLGLGNKSAAIKLISKSLHLSV